MCGEDFALACRVRRLAGRYLFNAEAQRTQSTTPSKLRFATTALFVTNVPLSGVADTGGRDRASAMLHEYSSKFPLKGSGFWDYNDLRGFLDGDADLRTAYGHFITSGDVLAQMMEALKPQRADFADVLHAFLQKELIADMSARLQSAGEDPEFQIPLASVFVDLPFAGSAEEAVLASEEEEEELPRVVHALLEAGSSVLRRVSDEGASTSREGQTSGRSVSLVMPRSAKRTRLTTPAES